jgi:urease accessory protein
VIPAIDARRSHAIGRIARLELRFERRSGRTVLAHGYAEPPLRVGRVFEIDDAAYVMLVCAGPGVFGGDRLQCRISVGSGATVLMTSQSAMQVHPTAADANAVATIAITGSVEEDGELLCQWDPVIPFAASRLVQRVELAAHGNGRIYWSDGLMAGRLSRGEVWRFASVDHQLRCLVDGRLSYLERYHLAPTDQSLNHSFVAHNVEYIGTAIVRHQAATDDAVESIHRALDGTPGVSTAVDLVDPARGVAVGRCLGSSGPLWHEVRQRLGDLVIDTVFDRPTLRFRR